MPKNRDLTMNNQTYIFTIVSYSTVNPELLFVVATSESDASGLAEQAGLTSFVVEDCIDCHSCDLFLSESVDYPQ